MESNYTVEKVQFQYRKAYTCRDVISMAIKIKFYGK